MSAVPAPVREARSDDLESLVCLLGELFNLEEDFQVAPDRQRAGLERLLATPDARVFVAESGAAVVGMCSIQTLISTAEGGSAGLVEDLIVRAEYRGRGIGSQLLGEVERWARVNGIRRLQLLAENKNSDALAFYRRSGWHATGLGVLRRSVASAGA